MKKTLDRFLIGLILLIFLISSSAIADDTPIQRLDPSLRIFVEQALQLAGEEVSIKSLLDSDSYAFSWTAAASDERIDLLVKLDRTFDGASFHGLPVTASTGSIVGVSATIPQILAMLEDEDVVYIEPSRRTFPALDASLGAIYADGLHLLTPPITGAGVLVGAVDTGIDYTHLNFRYDSDGDGFEESSRILSILDQTYGLFGIEYSRRDIETDLANGHGSSEGIVRQRDSDGHGTHVMGIAAGDGSSSVSGGFVGVAPDAYIVMVKTTFFTSDILAGVDHIFDLADELGLPAVVNLSLGGHGGPHDGSSLFEQGMDELVRGAGRVIVVSAGNEGDQSIHTSGTLAGNASSFYIDPDGWSTELTIWYPGRSQFMITVTPPTGLPIVAHWRTDSGTIQTDDGTVRIDNASAGVNANNGDNEVFIRLSGLSRSKRWQVTVTDTKGNGGRYNAWIINGAAAIVNGDSSSTIAEPGNAHEVITVGSFNSKAVWASLAGEQNFLNSYPLGELSSFSSQGPTRDGRIKPEITAPGAWVGSALSVDAGWMDFLVTPDGFHTMGLGTSQAAPHVSGAVALLFSIDSQLTAVEVRALLTESAKSDRFTGTVPNNRWGWGKLNVAAAVDLLNQAQPPPVDPPNGDNQMPVVTLERNPVDVIARFIISLPDGVTSAELRIYSADGSLVYDAFVDPGATRFEWPLITNWGKRVASGLYLYVLVTNRGTSTVGRLVIAR